MDDFNGLIHIQAIWIRSPANRQFGNPMDKALVIKSELKKDEFCKLHIKSFINQNPFSVLFEVINAGPSSIVRDSWVLD